MKMTILITTNFLLSFAASAGGNGSGTMSMTAAGVSSPSRAFVKFEGMDRSEVVFQYGVANSRDEVFTHQIRLRPEEIRSTSVIQALKKSKIQKNWAQLEP